MTPTEIENQARSLYNATNDTFFTQAEILNLIYKAELELANECNVIEAIISMSHSMNCQVIAEGIETTEQLDYLKQLGCDLGQGFLCSQPVPAADLLMLLQKGIFM